MSSINKYSSPISSAKYCAAIALQAQPWTNIGEIATLLSTLRNTNFNTVASRVAGLQAITGLNTMQPYSIRNSLTQSDIRFGDDTPNNTGVVTPGVNQFNPYFALWEPAVSEALQQIRSALQFKDPANDSPPDSGVQTPMESMVLFRSYQDASQSFRWGVQRLTDALATGRYIYDAMTFESKFQLIYSTAAQTPPPPAVVNTDNSGSSASGKRGVERAVVIAEDGSTLHPIAGERDTKVHPQDFVPDKVKPNRFAPSPVYSPDDEVISVLRKAGVRPLDIYHFATNLGRYCYDKSTANLAIEAYLDELARNPEITARRFLTGINFSPDDVHLEMKTV
jgi:hypothetical protein